MAFQIKKAPFSHAFLRSVLTYNARTGKWTRRKSPEKSVGHRRSDGYLFIRVGGKRFASHVLAWFYVRRRWPTKLVDHKNNNNADDRWKNLRLASWVQNRVNSKCRTGNKSGLKGVLYRRANYYQAVITVNKSRINLGFYRSAIEAHAAYKTAAKKHFGVFARAA